VFRGNGPRGCPFTPVAGLDQFLLDLSRSVGAITVRKLVTGLRAHGDRIEVSTSDGVAGDYDLVAVATGVNSQLLRTLRDAVPKYEPPGSRRTFICEFDLGEEAVRRCMGESMHVFVLDIPRLEFAALIPKGRFVTLCVLGDDVDDALVERLLATSIVSRCFPGSVVPPAVCHCFPRINTVPAVRPFADRMVWIGDSGVTRLYKDGIGSAYRTAKAAARTAIFRGISARDFERYFWPECRALAVDNRIGRVIFGLAAFVQRARFVRRGILRMTAIEQTSAGDRPMSSALWDLFSGSAPYREILRRVARPGFASTLAWHVIASNVQSTIAAGRRQTQPGKRDGA
jgi:hypothetical protein